MASLATIYGAMTEQDIEKQAEVAEAAGVTLVDEDTLEKAAHYDAIGRGLAHQLFEQIAADPELAKEAMGGMPPAFLANAKAKAEGKGEKKEEDDDDDDDEKKKAKKKEGDEEYSAKMEEKKAAVMQAMHDDDEYLEYIWDKYVRPAE